MSVLIKAMLFVRENGYPKKIGIIAWFDFILHIMRDIVRLHATKQENAESDEKHFRRLFFFDYKDNCWFLLELAKKSR